MSDHAITFRLVGKAGDLVQTPVPFFGHESIITPFDSTTLVRAVFEQWRSTEASRKLLGEASIDLRPIALMNPSLALKRLRIDPKTCSVVLVFDCGHRELLVPVGPAPGSAEEAVKQIMLATRLLSSGFKG